MKGGSMTAVHVYAAYNADTNGNGLAVIRPTEGSVHMEKNGVYDAEFTVPVDEHGKSEYLQTAALVKIPVRYHGGITMQLFRIYDTDRTEEQEGAAVKVKARHIFYDLTASMLKDCRPTMLDGNEALAWIMNGAYRGANNAFTYSSDISIRKTAYYQWKNITEALLGSDHAFVNVWGGSLYRNNYYFSINKEMEHSRNTGVIRYAYNMESISFKQNDAKCITYLIAEDNFGNKKELIHPDVPSRTFPHHRYGYKKFSYETENAALFEADAAAYLKAYSEPAVNIRIKPADLHDTDMYCDFLALSDGYEVGDRVIIYHAGFGISYKNLEIIAKTYDFVNDTTASIEIGSFRDALIREVV